MPSIIVMGVANIAAIVVCGLVSSLATLYVNKNIGEAPTVIVVSPDQDSGITEEFVTRTLKSIDIAEAEKHHSRARKLINSWQAGNLALGKDLYKLKLVPGPRGPTGPVEDRFKNTQLGTAIANKALAVDSNKDIGGIRYARCPCYPIISQD